MLKKRWHVNPWSGGTERCRGKLSKCIFFPSGAHFHDEDLANAAGRTIQDLQTWTALSPVRPEVLWYTVHVFDPRVERQPILSGLDRARPGHRLVIENGVIFEKTDVEYYSWRLVQSQLPTSRIGKDHHAGQLVFSLMKTGGRIETTPRLPPFDIDSTLDLSHLLDSRSVAP